MAEGDMRRVVVTLLVLTSAGFALGLFSRAETLAEPQDRESVPSPAFAPLGTSSCASAACHGKANAPSLTAAPAEACWQSSLTHYLAVDPHQNAYAALQNPLSQKITAALRRKSPGIPDAWHDTRCLACHSNPTLASERAPDAWFPRRTEGVSCEACHGNASEWKGPHLAWDKSSRAEGIKGTGFIDLNVPRVRAETCAGCHVGAPANAGRAVRDMNHDMIAAGHPELKFDYEKLLARMPKHWFEKDRHGGTLPADAKVTSSVGPSFVEALKADRRARNAKGDPRTPVPELSDQWACVTCHRELGAK
jgi:hypothetical protein